MDFDSIFEAYYNLYRLEAETPSTTDDEYPIAIRLANEAIRRWANYDGTYWHELFSTAQTDSTGGVVTITTGTTDYAAPTNFREAGGYVRILDANGVTVRRYPIADPEKKQFYSDMSQYCYFTGNQKTGFTLHLNPTTDTTINGLRIEYDYYKYPTLIPSDVDDAGIVKPEMQEPYFMVHRMLANRFRGSRNPYYGTAKTDAEDALRTMQAINNSGSWANPIKMEDPSGTAFGTAWGG